MFLKFLFISELFSVFFLVLFFFLWGVCYPRSKWEKNFSICVIFFSCLSLFFLFSLLILLCFAVCSSDIDGCLN